MKKGFTLVELSIVLVIIGLLIGGILIGQSLVDSVRVNSFVNQVSQFVIASDQFKNKYRQLPGDSPYHSPQGDGDGVLENSHMSAGSRTDSSQRADGEVIYFWAHLWQDGFLQNSYDEFRTSNSGGVSVAKGNFPEMTMGEGAESAGAAIFSNTEVWSSKNPGLHFRVVDYFGTSNRGTNTWGDKYCVFTPTEAFSIDKKMDNGLFSDGGGGVVPSSHCAQASGVGNVSNCYTSGEYDLVSDDGTKYCYLYIKFADY